MRHLKIRFGVVLLVYLFSHPCNAFDGITSDHRALTKRQNLCDGVYPVMTDETRFSALADEFGTINLGVLKVNAEREDASMIRIIKRPLVRFDKSTRFAFRLENNQCTQIEFENSEELKAFSKKFAPTRLAVVVGRQVVTHHKLRGALESKHIKITCCTEGGGDHLRKHLMPIAYSSAQTKSIEND